MIECHEGCALLFYIKEGRRGRKGHKVPVCWVRSHAGRQLTKTGDEMTAEMWQGLQRRRTCALGTEVSACDES